MSKVCPGQDTRYWRPDDIFEVTCGSCGRPVEFFKDDVRRRCRSCGTVVQNPRVTLGCAQWCEHAKECLGYDPQAVARDGKDEESLLDRLVAAMKRSLAGDQQRISHALAVTDEAEQILQKETASRPVVLATVLVLDVAGDLEPAARRAKRRELLADVGLDDARAKDVCELLDALETGDAQGPESAIVLEAVRRAAAASAGAGPRQRTA